ncbi:MAG: DNA polymerase III subunit gamma/tau [Clostridia bacterium]|nr:DNA polymerase III subunit gamma/tau [Clostridia bacterium]
MSYIALYRKWRPLVFEDVVEQEHVVKTLKNSVVTGRIAHAYLFCGTRGTGKTTMAKIFSRAINCLQPKDGDPCNECDVCKGILSQNILDVVEIDAASNNSVDNVREIRDEVIYAPSQAKHKVYIIDEVHMLSTGAFNALLKTLEEPPSHVVFILATTEPHKLPATILSRCQRYDFRRISVESIMARLDNIAQAGGVSIQKEALRLIAKLSDGALRDAISILDQCMGLGTAEVSYNDVLSVVGIVNDVFIAQVVDALNSKEIHKILQLIEELVMNGKDATQFVSDLVYYYRNLLICKITDKPGEIIEASAEVIDTMKRQVSSLSQDEIMHVIKELSLLESSLKWTTHPRILLEVSLLKICKSNSSLDSDNILGRLALLEEKISSGTITVSTGNREAAAPANKPGASAEKKTASASDSSASKEKDAPVAFTGAGKTLPMWDKVLEELRKSGRMVLFTNLIGSKAIEIDQKIVGIVFENGGSFNKMLVSKAENAEVLESVLGKVLGREVRIKCLDADDARNSTKSAQPEEKDEFVEKAQEIAKRINAPLNIIDE